MDPGAAPCEEELPRGFLSSHDLVTDWVHPGSSQQEMVLWGGKKKTLRKVTSLALLNPYNSSTTLQFEAQSS